MKHYRFNLLFCAAVLSALALPAKAQLIHSHNDYLQSAPFRGAFNAGANSIEADVWCIDEDLYVAHDKKDVQKHNTLRKMYLKPLKKALRSGKPHGQPLQLMVDVKNGKAALDKLVEIIEKEGFRKCFDPALNPNAICLTITCWNDLSESWTSYPEYVRFDARPGASLSSEQWKRASMMSLGLGSFTKWKGNGAMTENDKEKIRAAAKEAHSKGLPFRIWGFPDNPAAWQLSLELGMDYINTDHPDKVAGWLSR